MTVAVTGGSVTTKGMHEHAVEALQEGTGDAIVNVSDGATITSKENAGILAQLRLAGNDEGQVKVTQGGTIAGRTGVHAYVSRDSAMGETRTAANQPLIDVTWTGAFSHGTTATVAQDDSDRWGGFRRHRRAQTPSDRGGREGHPLRNAGGHRCPGHVLERCGGASGGRPTIRARSWTTRSR